MTRVFLIRHAEAEGNLYRRVHGWYNSTITDMGYRQIAALEHRFKNEKIDAVYASDLFRTRTTARAIYPSHGLPLETRRELREIHVGDWEDQTWGGLARTDPERLNLFNAVSPLFEAPGDGETYAQIQARVSRALRRIVADHPGQTVAVFSHGVAIRCMLSDLMGLFVCDAMDLPHSDNTAVSLVEFDGDRAKIVFANDNSHLPEEISTFAKQQWWKKNTGSLADTNLWFTSLDMENHSDLYRMCRREAWLNIHGTMQGYDEERFYRDALAQWKQDHRAVTCAMLDDKAVGLLQMDTGRYAELGAGYMPFVYMMPNRRKQGLGVQLLGEAVSLFRPLGRDRLRLRCAPDNAIAQRFYQRYGFRKVGEEENSAVPLDILEKYIGYERGAR
ncbi:MAG: bifunctional histidine phosphatase family protein/GNAT family N-acetyltransferase [Intestinimonas sp.]|nr:bifunctional histidine phosphatase family protein/GNAT family N-acetyltransferase [Intestinimonas sp.]